MVRLMSSSQDREKILVLCRAIPEESKKYYRTVCVAGITDGGEFRRIYPVQFKPFQANVGIPFHKKDWIEATVLPPEDKRDTRPESRKLDFGSVRVVGKADDDQIRQIVVKHLSSSVKAVQDSSASLGFIKPRITDFDCVIKSTEELDRSQVDLEGRVSGKIKMDQESRYKFYCQDRRGCCEGRLHNMEIRDWEANELYRNVIRTEKKHSVIKQKIRQKWFDWMTTQRDMYFMMGTHHLYKTWMIVSVLYLKKP